MIASFSAMDLLTGRDARKQRQFIQGAFSRYVSPKVVEALVDDPSRMSLEGERREMTYLFTDIADFTTMSEKIDSKDLAHLLNAYFEGVTASCCAMTAWSTNSSAMRCSRFSTRRCDVAPPCRTRRALRAGDRRVLREISASDRTPPASTSAITRIGVHTGTAVIGNFGSQFALQLHGPGRRGEHRRAARRAQQGIRHPCLRQRGDRDACATESVPPDRIGRPERQGAVDRSVGAPAPGRDAPELARTLSRRLLAPA